MRLPCCNACGIPILGTNSIGDGSLKDFDARILGRFTNGGQDRGRVAFGDEKNRGACTAEGNSENAWGSGEGEQPGEEGTGLHAIGLMDPILHGCGEKVTAAKGEGGDQKRRGLNVGDRVFAGVVVGKEGSRLAGGEAGGRKGE